MNKLRGKRTKQYSGEVRCFVLTLDFYSPKAYEYVREMFKKSLPSRRTLQKWYRTVSCKPGFHEECLQTLKQKVRASQKPVFCSLMMDEMSIRKNIHWDGKKFVGYVDFGVDADSDSTPVAKEALVFMVNAVNGRWKLPVGYFFVSSVNAEKKSQFSWSMSQFSRRIWRAHYVINFWWRCY